MTFFLNKENGGGGYLNLQCHPEKRIFIVLLWNRWPEVASSAKLDVIGGGAANREPAAATSTWSSDTRPLAAEQRIPESGTPAVLFGVLPDGTVADDPAAVCSESLSEAPAFDRKMANDSPAKSLVEIDLASLRVSPADVFFSFLRFFCGSLTVFLGKHGVV